MTSLLNFIKIYQLVQKLLGGGHTDRLVISQASLSFGRKVGLDTLPGVTIAAAVGLTSRLSSIFKV
jgi:hypothetical protein